MKVDVKLVLITLAAVIGVILIAVFGMQGVQDKAIAMEEVIENSLSDINVQEKRRADLIPNLVDTVKAYDEHEYNTMMAIVNGRGNNLGDADVEEIKTMINAVAEAYPELQSATNYQELMNELATTENLIANYRSNYNKAITSYNQYVRKFFNRTVLGILGYESYDYQRINFEISHDAPTNLFG